MHAHTIRHYQLCCKHNVSLKHYFPLKASKCRKFCDWNNFSAVIFLGRLFYIWLPPCLLYEQLVGLLWRENRSICKEEIHHMELDAHMHAHMNTHTHTHTHRLRYLAASWSISLSRTRGTTLQRWVLFVEGKNLKTWCVPSLSSSTNCPGIVKWCWALSTRLGWEREVSEWGRCYWC